MISLTTTDGCATYVAVAADEDSLLADLPIVGEGAAFCCPSDVFDPAIGEGIALGRAIQNFGRQVEAHFMEAVVTKDEYARVLDLIRRDPTVAHISGLQAGDAFIVQMHEDHMHVDSLTGGVAFAGSR